MEAAFRPIVRGGSKPYKDLFPQVPTYSGDGPPDRFLRDMRTWNLLFPGGPLEPATLVHQLLGKRTDKAARRASRRFAEGTPATVAAISAGLRATFSREYEGARVLLAIYRLYTNYHLDGNQRLNTLEELHAQARDYFVLLNPGPHESTFCQLLDLFSPVELPAFLAELTSNSQCNEAALRLIEEQDMDTAALQEGWGPPRSSLLVPPSPEREALFALRVTLAQAALKRIQAPHHPASLNRQARAYLTEGHHTSPSQPPSTGPIPFPCPPAVFPGTPPASTVHQPRQHPPTPWRPGAASSYHQEPSALLRRQ